MKVYLSPYKTKTTVIEHEQGGKKYEIEFNNNALAKTAFVVAVNDENPIFTHLNRYLKRLSQEMQDDIFEIINQISYVMSESATIEEINKKLSTLFIHLFQRISFEHIYDLVLHDKEFNHDITLPSPDNIKMAYESVSDNYTKEKTYIYSEYQQLIALIVQLRIMFPIWASYIELFNDKLGTNYKEYEAFKLIHDSGLFKNNPAMEKLARYVQANTPQEGSKAAIIDFISSENYPLYNLALVVVRKICTMEIRNPGERHPILIMHISTHVREKISNNDKKQGAIIANKIGQDFKSSSEERQVSLYERFKIREKLTVGEKVFLLESVNNPLDLATKLKPGIDLDFVNMIVSETMRMGSTPVERVQKILLKNMIASIAPYKTVDLMNRSTLINSLGAVAAVLIDDGFIEIAQFCTASTIHSTTGGVTIATDQHQNKVTQELRDKMFGLMPFQRAGRSKAQVSPISDNIDLIFKEITTRAWNSNLPDHLIANDGGPVIRRIKIPSNLRIRLTEFAIYISERSQGTVNVEDKLTHLQY